MQKLLRQLALMGTLLASAISAAQTTNTPQVEVKPGCQDKCGNVSIPFPFGTTKECYYDKDFLITCNDTDYNPPKPFLRKSNIEVTDISVDGKLYITQYIAEACYDKSGAPLDSNNPSLSLAQFFISDTENKFIGVGCDTRAEIKGFQGENYQYTGGCFTKCSSMEYIENYTCSGIGCCQTPIAKGMTYFDIEVKSYKNQTKVWKFNPCSFAFVVQEGKFNFTSNMLKDLRSVEKLPAVLDWSIGNKSCSNVVENKACQGNSTCSDFDNGLGYRCKCNDGYEGNPYLGCHDIDECKDPKLNECKQVCKNTEGNYTCSCRKGYHGDGRASGEGCTANRTFVIQITVGLGVGLISLIISISWLYLGYKRWKLMKLKEKFFRQNGGLLLEQQLSERQYATNQTAKIFTEDQLKKATNNFSENRIIGQGGFGTVYKGILADETAVAIKKSKIVDRSQIEQFINEVLVLSQINLRNVVKLLGCCFETEVPLLVYEFVTNGTLTKPQNASDDGAVLSSDELICCRLLA